MIETRRLRCSSSWSPVRRQAESTAKKRKKKKSREDGEARGWTAGSRRSPQLRHREETFIVDDELEAEARVPHPRNAQSAAERELRRCAETPWRWQP